MAQIPEILRDLAGLAWEGDRLTGDPPADLVERLARARIHAAVLRVTEGGPTDEEAQRVRAALDALGERLPGELARLGQHVLMVWAYQIGFRDGVTLAPVLRDRPD